MSNLAAKKCAPCRKGDPPLSAADISLHAAQVPDWAVEGEPQTLRRTYKFPAYLAGAAFLTAVAAMADAEDHHPDLALGYKKVHVGWSTHAVNGLSLNDFICAAKCDALFKP